MQRRLGDQVGRGGQQTDAACHRRRTEQRGPQHPTRDRPRQFHQPPECVVHVVVPLSYALTNSQYVADCASSCLCVLSAMTPPPSSMTTRSTLPTVCKRWVMISAMRPCIRACSASSTACSLALSRCGGHNIWLPFSPLSDRGSKRFQRQERCSVNEFDLFIGDMTPLDVPGRHVERGPSSGLFEVFEICASFRGRRGPEVPAVVR